MFGTEPELDNAILLSLSSFSGPKQWCLDDWYWRLCIAAAHILEARPVNITIHHIHSPGAG